MTFINIHLENIIMKYASIYFWQYYYISFDNKTYKINMFRKQL